MLLNGAPLNGAPLNGGGSVAPAPVYVVRGIGYRWRLRLLVGGVDMTEQLTGGADVDREEGAAGVAGFDLYLPSGPVVPTDWIGKAVTLDYISTSSGVTTEARRFTGQIISPTWNPTTRLLSCECSDQLQQRVEAKTIAEIDALCPGYWSADVFEAVEGRSHWDYALERLSTRPVSLDCSPTGELRVSSWYATAPAFVFGPGTTLYQTMGLDLAPLSNITNRVEIEFSYRYSRLWQRNQHYTWLVPAGTFCTWRINTHELPTVDMIEDAATDGGQTMINASFAYLPPSAPDPCNTGVPWINIHTDLLLGAGWTAARRWAQTVTETYTLVLATPAGRVEGTQVVQRQSASFEIDADRVAAWTEDEITGGVSGYEDVHDEARRSAALLVTLQAARVEIIAAHRETTISWDAPTSLAMGVDLIHTLHLNNQGVQALGKCRRLVDKFDLASGAAITTLSIAVMRGGGGSDPLTLPPRLGSAAVDPGELPSDSLPSQIGGRSDSPPYDEDLDGFAGNWDFIDNDVGQEPYPRRMTALAPETPAIDRDEYPLTAATLYRVGIPNDTLEL